MVVKPTRSAKRTDTSRRSATGGDVGPSDAGMADAKTATPAVGPVNDVPHSPQNFASAGLAVPQLGQETASTVPHSLQNLRPASFSVAQFEQITCSMWPSGDEPYQPTRRPPSTGRTGRRRLNGQRRS